MVMAKRPRTKYGLRVPLIELLKDVPWFKVEGHSNPPKFGGPLKKPIIVKQRLGPVLDDLMDDIFKQRLEKLVLLMDYYNLETDDNAWLLLSLRLACAFVPGLKVSRKGVGAPAKWKDRGGDIIAAVQAEMKRTGGGVAKAIDSLKRDNPDEWKSFNEPRYYELRRRLRK
jgi:hypothetical protein